MRLILEFFREIKRESSVWDFVLYKEECVCFEIKKKTRGVYCFKGERNFFFWVCFLVIGVYTK